MLQGYRTATEIWLYNKHEYIYMHMKQNTDLVKQRVNNLLLSLFFHALAYSVCYHEL